MNLCRVTASVVIAFSCTLALAQRGRDNADSPPADDKAKSPMVNPLPADAHVAQSIQVNGAPLKYTATVGTLPVKECGRQADR